mgnify:CR=1 FL=1
MKIIKERMRSTRIIISKDIAIESVAESIEEAAHLPDVDCIPVREEDREQRVGHGTHHDARHFVASATSASRKVH